MFGTLRFAYCALKDVLSKRQEELYGPFVCGEKHSRTREKGKIKLVKIVLFWHQGHGKLCFQST